MWFGDQCWLLVITFLIKHTHRLGAGDSDRDSPQIRFYAPSVTLHPILPEAIVATFLPGSNRFCARRGTDQPNPSDAAIFVQMQVAMDDNPHAMSNPQSYQTVALLSRDLVAASL